VSGSGISWAICKSTPCPRQCKDAKISQNSTVNLEVMAQEIAVCYLPVLSVSVVGGYVCRQKTDMAKSARRVHARSPFSDGVPAQECASRRPKFARVVQG